MIGVFDLRHLTLPGLWYLTYLAVVVIPSFFVFAEQVEPYRSRYLFAVESVLVTAPFGVFLGKALLHSGREETVRYFAAPIRAEPGDRSLLVYSGLLILTLLVAITYIIEVENIPLSYLVAHPGAYIETGYLREESMKLLKSRFAYVYFLARSSVYPFLILLAYGRYLRTRQRKWLLAFMFCLVTGVLYAGLTTAKSPVATIVVAIYILHYLFRSGRVSVRSVFAGMVCFIAFPVAVTAFMRYGTGLGPLGITASLWRRLFYVPAEVLYYYFEIFPDVIPYLHGRTIGKVAELFGVEPVNVANLVALYVNPRSGSRFASAPFVGNLNADFGLFGVLAGGFLVGVLLQVVHVFLLRRAKTMLNLSTYAFLSMSFVLLNSTALTTVLFSYGVFVILFLVWSIEFLESLRGHSRHSFGVASASQKTQRRGVLTSHQRG
jgi:oligosaccharide repeat unit polymerase